MIGMPSLILRTVTASDLRDPEVLAEAGRSPIGVFDGRRSESLVLTSRAAYDNDQQLHRFMGLLAHAVVELAREDPSPSALAEAGYVADWLPVHRTWWLRSFAEVVASAAEQGSTEPIVGFIEQARKADESMASPLESTIDAARFAAKTKKKLIARTGVLQP